MKVRIITQKVESILNRFPETRDNDDALCARYWHDQIYDKYNVNEMSAKELLTLLYRGELESPESIVRSRRKIQETNPSLRGLKYDSRKAHTETIKLSLGYKTKTS